MSFLLLLWRNTEILTTGPEVEVDFWGSDLIDDGPERGDEGHGELAEVGATLTIASTDEDVLWFVISSKLSLGCFTSRVWH